MLITCLFIYRLCIVIFNTLNATTGICTTYVGGLRQYRTRIFDAENVLLHRELTTRVHQRLKFTPKIHQLFNSNFLSPGSLCSSISLYPSSISWLSVASSAKSEGGASFLYVILYSTEGARRRSLFAIFTF